MRAVASGLNRQAVWHWGPLATITTSSTTKTCITTSTITGIASCFSWLVQQHGEDLSGLLAQLSPHLLVHPLSGTPSQSRRTHIKGKCAHGSQRFSRNSSDGDFRRSSVSYLAESHKITATVKSGIAPSQQAPDDTVLCL